MWDGLGGGENVSFYLNHFRNDEIDDFEQEYMMLVTIEDR